MATKMTDTRHYSAIADAIRQKLDTLDTYTPAEMAPAIESIPTGGGGALTESDVNFFDYDGTLLHSYTAEEFLELQDFPELPEHEGLAATDWGWTIERAQAFVADYGALDFSIFYLPDDLATKIHVTLTEDTLEPVLAFTLYGTASVDWGDGSEPDEVTAQTRTTVAHTYDEPGDYIISILCIGDSSQIYLEGDMSYGSQILTRNGASNDGYRIKYLRTITEINLGHMCRLSGYACKNLFNLRAISCTGAESDQSQLFMNCYSLRHIHLKKIPVTSGMFENCSSLEHVTITDEVQAITTQPAACFTKCASLHRLNAGYCTKAPGCEGSVNLRTIIAPSATSIGSNAGCTNLETVVTDNGLGSTTVGSTFKSCQKLRSVKIYTGSTTTTIQAMDFQDCQSLEAITIPANISTIKGNCFGNCLSMREVHVLKSTPPTIQSNSFTGLPTWCKIYVPEASVETYKAATNWATYAAQIFGE